MSWQAREGKTREENMGVCTSIADEWVQGDKQRYCSGHEFGMIGLGWEDDVVGGSKSPSKSDTMVQGDKQRYCPGELDWQEEWHEFGRIGLGSEDDVVVGSKSTSKSDTMVQGDKRLYCPGELDRQKEWDAFGRMGCENRRVGQERRLCHG